MDNDDTTAQGPIIDAARLELARMAIEAVKFHLDTVSRMFPAELAALNVDDDMHLALKVLRKVTS